MDTINCTEQLRLVEGAHRMCAHSDLDEMFDEKFDMYLPQWINCDIECNVCLSLNQYICLFIFIRLKIYKLYISI